MVVFTAPWGRVVLGLPSFPFGVAVSFVDLSVILCLSFSLLALRLSLESFGLVVFVDTGIV